LLQISVLTEAEGLDKFPDNPSRVAAKWKVKRRCGVVV
jgi:hypothetical protein